MDINLHVERLVLDGIDIPYHQQPAFQAAVEAELARLLGELGLGAGLASGGTLRELPGGMVQGDAGADPAGFGQQVARAIYGGIGR